MLALIAAAAIAAAAIAADDAPTPPPDDPHAAYRAARAAAGHAPDDQVRLAYWCEAHGLAAERTRHLAQAALADPDHAAARGLLGLVARQDRWARPEAVADQVRADATLAATLADYDARRSAAPYTADGQWALAQWADDRGLKDQARAHWTAVVRLDPRRELAWKKLGYRNHDGRWATDAELAAARADADAQKAADHRWKGQLERWKAQLARPSQRAEAEAGLLAVTDPRAVPAIAHAFGAREVDAARAVQLLGQIDAPAASRGLASLALAGPTPEARRAATETLRRRDPREYANLLIAQLGKPIRYEVKPVDGPNSPGVLFVEGERANVKRLYEPKSLIQPGDRIAIDRFGQPVVERVTSASAYSLGGRAFNPRILTGLASSYSDSYGSTSMEVGNFGFPAAGMAGIRTWHPNPGPAGLPPQLAQGLDAAIARGSSAAKHGSSKSSRAGVGATLRALEGGAGSQPGFLPRDFAQQQSVEFSLAQVQAEQARSARASQQQLDGDVAMLDRQNRATLDANDRVVAILHAATGADLPADRSQWERWWVDLLGYAQVAGQTEQNPTFVEVVPSGYQPEVAPSNVVNRSIAVSGISCFGAGTLVRTMTGPRAIEDLKVGDLVLTQSTTTGALGYQPITVTHHNPPAGTFRIRLGDDTIVASHFHRFWVARRGWVMARDLRVGDSIRVLGGVRPVDSVEAGRVEPVYNLDVADDADFFAGSSAALVHDNTLPDPRLVPFDLPDARAVAAR